jgi:hypothetical protein
VGARLAYERTAAKWAGPVGGRAHGYGTLQLRSTTRRVVGGAAPAEQRGSWEDAALAARDAFHAAPVPRPVHETRALRVASVKAVPANGRSFIDVGTTGLAIDNPEQYRGDVVRHIAEESTRYAAMFGNSYGVEISGLSGDLYWQQASETEVFLYIEHNFTIRPR